MEPFTSMNRTLLLALCAGFVGCTEASKATGPASDIPAARISDTLCQAASGLDSTDKDGVGSTTRILRSCLERVAGDWILDSTALPDVETALDSAVSPYPTAWRVQVRSRLQQVLHVPTTLRVRIPWPRVAVDYDGDSGIAARPDGTLTPFEDYDLGETIQLQSRWANGALVQTFVASDGIRTDSLAIEQEGARIILVQTTTSEAMLRPLVLRMQYRRK